MQKWWRDTINVAGPMGHGELRNCTDLVRIIMQVHTMARARGLEPCLMYGRVRGKTKAATWTHSDAGQL
eukprot:m.282198 g.282198  ORF g.282198 m.282198 type:complete len:69 (+) comp26981_c0_seq1:1150-1356(+)